MASTDIVPRRNSLMNRVWLRRLSVAGGGIAVIALCIGLRMWTGAEQANAQGIFSRAKPAAASQQAPEPVAEQPQPPSKPHVVAVVNGQPITRNDLAQECLWHYGESVLDSLVNKTLIIEHCRRDQLSVSDEEVQAEIARMAERFGVPTEQWLKMLKDERNISPAQYARDIIWPTLALRKLADRRLEVTDDDMRQAYETQFGPAVQVRLISCRDLAKLQQVRALALANPDDFGNLAKQHSDDTNSAAARGLIQPIRKHLGDARIEQVAFALQPNEVSEIVQVGDQYVLLKCESHIPGRQVPMEQVRQVLHDAIRDKKLRLVAGEVFQQLQAETPIELVFTDPEKSRQQPNVAARVGEHVISVADLAEECMERHGVEVVEGTINRRLLEQALKRANLQVTQVDLDAEIARAALSFGKTKPNSDEPDIERWLKEVSETQKISVELYIHDAVWPSAALKKLVAEQVTVDEDDLRKGYEANYGPRVRCRAIVCNQLRRAQEAWELARQNPTPEHFGKLAQQYSVDSTSAAIGGEVPPIQRHGGQPLLEREAFGLKPGELSGIIQVDEVFVILLCTGHTNPNPIDFAEVRDAIYEDVMEKKLRVSMAQELARLQEAAQIDNFLAGTSHSPTKGQSIQQRVPTPVTGAPAATRTR